MVAEASRESILREVRRVHREWPRFLSDSPLKVEKAALALSPEERKEGYRLASTFVQQCRERKEAVCSFAVYLKEKRWEKLADIGALPAARAVTSASGRAVAAPFGPIWTGLCIMAFLDGPVVVARPDDARAAATSIFEAHRRFSERRALDYLERKGLSLGADGWIVFPDDFEATDYRQRVMEEGYPEVNRLYQIAAMRQRTFTDARYEAITGLSEAVPVGSAVFEDWQRHFRDSSWKWIPDPGNFPVVWFPRGGPAGLGEFRAAMERLRRGENGSGGVGDDAA